MPRFCKTSGEFLQHLENFKKLIIASSIGLWISLDIFGSSDLSFTIFGAIFGHHGRSLLEPLVDGTSIHLEPRSLDVNDVAQPWGAEIASLLICLSLLESLFVYVTYKYRTYNMIYNYNMIYHIYIYMQMSANIVLNARSLY